MDYIICEYSQVPRLGMTVATWRPVTAEELAEITDFSRIPYVFPVDTNVRPV